MSLRWTEANSSHSPAGSSASSLLCSRITSVNTSLRIALLASVISKCIGTRISPIPAIVRSLSIIFRGLLYPDSRFQALLKARCAPIGIMGRAHQIGERDCAVLIRGIGGLASQDRALCGGVLLIEPISTARYLRCGFRNSRCIDTERCQDVSPRLGLRCRVAPIIRVSRELL